ncbi:MAG: hypothetical protein HW421_1619 [Ignavibacteria bacterium]|nr:hypothetical protein [Ignavibacteria bacterium]
MEGSEKKKITISYDESFKILMAGYFGKFAKVITDYEIIDLPKRVDVLVIEMNKPIAPYVELLTYFKRFNIVEFKSEKDRFNIYDDLYKLGIYICGLLLKEPEANVKNTTFTLVSSLRPGKLLKQYKAEHIRQGLYIIEDISLIPVYVVIPEELELRYDKEISVLKEFTSKKDRSEFIKGLLTGGETIEEYENLMRITSILYSIQLIKIIKQEGFMNTIERNFRKAIKELGFDQEFIKIGLEQGMQQGMQQGINEGIEKIARNALMRGFSIDEIALLTGLTKSQIKKLKNLSGN